MWGVGRVLDACFFCCLYMCGVDLSFLSCLSVGVGVCGSCWSIILCACSGGGAPWQQPRRQLDPPEGSGQLRLLCYMMRSGVLDDQFMAFVGFSVDVGLCCSTRRLAAPPPPCSWPAPGLKHAAPLLPRCWRVQMSVVIVLGVWQIHVVRILWLSAPSGKLRLP